MMTQTTITAPDGYQIDPVALKNNKIEFIPIKNVLPQSWEELNYIKGAYINVDSTIESGIDSATTNEEDNRNVLPTKELAEAMLALCQLLQLRDRYNDGWKPNWTNNDQKYIIICWGNLVFPDISTNIQRPLTFKTKELRDAFLNAPKIRELIEIAKPLL